MRGLGLLNTPEGDRYGPGFGVVQELPAFSALPRGVRGGFAGAVLRAFFKPRFGIGVVFSAGFFSPVEAWASLRGAAGVLQRHIGDDR